jgi:hypothetical protein
MVFLNDKKIYTRALQKITTSVGARTETAATGAEEEDPLTACKTVAKHPEGIFTLATAETGAEEEEHPMPA